MTKEVVRPYSELHETYKNFLTTKTLPKTAPENS
jgi:hypothetical protein